MPWSPTYGGDLTRPMGAKLIGAIQDNVLSIIETDEAAALAYVNGGTALPAFKAHAKARRVNTQHPFLGVFAVSTKPNEGEGFLQPRHELAVEIELLNSDPEALAVAIEKYTRAVLLLILSATPAQMRAGLSSPTGKVNWFIENMEWSGTLEHEIKKSQFFHISRMQLIVTLDEQ